MRRETFHYLNYRSCFPEMLLLCLNFLFCFWCKLSTHEETKGSMDCTTLIFQPRQSNWELEGAEGGGMTVLEGTQHTDLYSSLKLQKFLYTNIDNKPSLVNLEWGKIVSSPIQSKDTEPKDTCPIPIRLWHSKSKHITYSCRERVWFSGWSSS